MKSPQSSSPPPDQHITVARQLLDGKRFKEAIATCKEALKSRPNPPLEQVLAQAYQGRALEVAAKGMFPEAIMLWENQAKITGQTLWQPCYVNWLLAAGQYNKLASQADTLTAALTPCGMARPVLETLALLALNDSKLLAQLPADHPIVKHQPVLLKALNAYTRREDGVLEDCLQQIPSRSPYREVRTLLKGLLTLETDRSAGLATLSRIATDSVIHPLVEHLIRQTSEHGIDPRSYGQLENKLQTLLNKLNGYGKHQLDLIRNLKKINPDSSERILFEFALNNRQALGEESARRYCHALLSTYPDGFKLYERHFGALPTLEKLRQKALALESSLGLRDAIWVWQDYIAELRKQQRDEDAAHNDLVEAIIQRYCFRLTGSDHSRRTLKFLIKSLELDPLDKDSYSHLISGLRKSDPKESLAWLDKALEHFPKDLDFLTQAMHAATERGAFKKAVGYARAILDIDSLNSTARECMIESRLGHARKQIQTGRLDLAQQEIAAAADLDVHGRNSSIFYLGGIIAILSGDAERGNGLLQQGACVDRSPLVAELRFSIERIELGLTNRGKNKYPSFVDKKYQPDRADLQALARKLAGIPKKLWPALHKALATLQPVILRGTKAGQTSEDDLAELCQSLAAVEDYTCLRRVCKSFDYRMVMLSVTLGFYQVLAECKGEPSRLSLAESTRLAFLKMLAANNNDERGAKLITQFMGRYYSGLSSADEPEDEYDESDEFDPDQFDARQIRSFSEDKRLGLFLREMTHIEYMSTSEILARLTAISGRQFPSTMERQDIISELIRNLMQKYHLDAAHLEEYIDFE